MIKLDNNHLILGLDTVIEYLIKNKIYHPERDVYDFGVCTAGGTQSIAYYFKKYSIAYHMFYGFDSLEGLPKEDPSQPCPDLWQERAFNIQSVCNLQNKEEAEKFIYDKLEGYKFRLIEGYFSDSLTDSLMIKNDFKPALFLSIDVDLYISTVQVLDFMYRHNLIVKDTIIRYDEWGGEDTGTPAGEERAHKEFEKKYNARFKSIYFEQGVRILVCR